MLCDFLGEGTPAAGPTLPAKVMCDSTTSAKAARGCAASIAELVLLEASTAALPAFADADRCEEGPCKATRECPLCEVPATRPSLLSAKSAAPAFDSRSASDRKWLKSADSVSSAFLQRRRSLELRALESNSTTRRSFVKPRWPFRKKPMQEAATARSCGSPMAFNLDRLQKLATGSTWLQLLAPGLRRRSSTVDATESPRNSNFRSDRGNRRRFGLETSAASKTSEKKKVDFSPRHCSSALRPSIWTCSHDQTRLFQALGLHRATACLQSTFYQYVSMPEDL